MAGGGEGGGRYGSASGRRISTYRPASSCRCRRSGSTAVTPPSTCGAIPPPPRGGDDDDDLRPVPRRVQRRAGSGGQRRVPPAGRTDLPHKPDGRVRRERCPAGLPIRAVVGVRSPDPMMLVALRCDDVKASAEFYASLGFGAGARYPYAHPNDGAGQFEPAQSAGSAYLAPAANSMGVLLLPRREGRGGVFFGGGRLGPFVPNPALASLNVG